MKWSQVMEDPSLRDLPYKIELNEHGSIVMTPASNRHGRLQFRLAKRLSEVIPDGEVMVECSIDTTKGTWSSSTTGAKRKRLQFSRLFPEKSRLFVDDDDGECFSISIVTDFRSVVSKR